MSPTKEARPEDSWGDFLRRLLLSASLAGAVLPAAGPTDNAGPPAEQPAPQPSGQSSAR